MESFLTFLMVFITIIGPSLVIGAVILGIPITLIVLAARGRKLTAKVIMLSVAAIICIPIVTEIIAVVGLLVIFQLFGKA